MERRVLILGYGRHQTPLHDAMTRAEWVVTHTDKPIKSLAGFNTIISFGYRYILSETVLASAQKPVINLHISFLPWNRGAHPNFWAFFDGTPCGVSIHYMDPGVDTGPILLQEHANFSPDTMTFRQTHSLLVAQIEGLFLQNLDGLLNHQIEALPQVGPGTCHQQRDIPDRFSGWDSIIKPEIERLKNDP